MYYKIEQIEGIGAVYASQLARAGIATTEDLLDLCADQEGRESVTEATGISLDRILKWSNLADLMRIRGIGPQFSELLEAAGVDTVKELRRRNAESLADAMERANVSRKLTRTTPTVTTVSKWVGLAKTTEPVIHY